MKSSRSKVHASRFRNKPKSRARGDHKKTAKAGKVSRSRHLQVSKSHFSVRNSYEAASGGRRLRLWNPGSPGPNDSILSNLTQLRNRSRDLVRNNPWISRGISSWTANEIGCGITFKAMSPDVEWNKLADELWERQTQHFDADHMMDFHGMLTQIVRTRRTAGEIFIRRRIRRPGELPVPLQYQLLEPEFCPHDWSGLSAFAGRTVKAGIEFDGIGRRRAYLMYRAHPGDFFFNTQTNDLQLVAVPASEIIHHYAMLRPGQIRGIPAIVQAMIKAKEFDEYDDAELVRKKTRAAWAGMITRPNWNPDEGYNFDPFSGEPIEKDKQGVGITQVESGQFFTGHPGEGLELFEGDNTGSGYTDFVRQQLLGIGAGQDVPYSFLSGDFSELNDRTLRVVLAEYHRTIEQDRWQLTIPQVCYPIWRDFIDMAILSGALPEPADYATKREEYLKVVCTPEGWPYLHALQDSQGDVLRWKNGLTSRKRVAAERGEDIREIDQENQEDQARAEELGLEYGEDPAQEDTEDEPVEAEQKARARVQKFRAVNAGLY